MFISNISCYLYIIVCNVEKGLQIVRINVKPLYSTSCVMIYRSVLSSLSVQFVNVVPCAGCSPLHISILHLCVEI